MNIKYLKFALIVKPNCIIITSSCLCSSSSSFTRRSKSMKKSSLYLHYYSVCDMDCLSLLDLPINCNCACKSESFDHQTIGTNKRHVYSQMMLRGSHSDTCKNIELWLSFIINVKRVVLTFDI